MILNPYRTVICLLAMVLLAGCASQPSHHYSLSGIREAPSGTFSNLSLSVGPVSVPEPVNRPEIVLQAGPNRLVLDEFNLWAGPLHFEIQRVLMENLASLLGTDRVFRYPQGAINFPDFRVEVNVLRFESTLGSVALLDAVWTIRDKDAKELKTGRTTLHKPVSAESYDALAAAHSRALAALAREVADAIRKLEGSAG